MQIKGLSDIVNISEYFLGEVDGDNNFDCPHGPAECQGDMIELCAQAVTGAKSEWGWWNMGVCMQADYDNIPDNAQSCAQQAGLDWSAINDCVNNGMGDKLLTQSFDDSQNVDEAPTIMIGGSEATDCENGDGCLQDVCNAYTGPPPPACSSLLKKRGTAAPKKFKKSRVSRMKRRQ